MPDDYSDYFLQPDYRMYLVLPFKEPTGFPLIILHFYWKYKTLNDQKVPKLLHCPKLLHSVRIFFRKLFTSQGLLFLSHDFFRRDFSNFQKQPSDI